MQADERLSEENTVLKTILSASSAYIAYQDTEGRFQFVTAAVARSYGLTPDVMVGRTIEDLGLKAEVVEAVESIRKEALASGRTVSSEVRSSHTGKYYLYTYTPISGNGVQGTVGMAADITDQKRVEDELRSSEDKLRSIIDSTNDPVFLKDTEGRWLMVNRAALWMVGRRLDDVIGMRDDQILSGSDVVRRMMVVDRRVIETGISVTTEETLPTPAGSRTYLTTKTPFRDARGEIIGLVGLARDITERKEWEEALRSSEQRFRALIEGAPMAISIVRDDSIEYANPRYLEMYGLSDLEEVRGHPFVERFILRDRAAIREWARRIGHGLPELREREYTGLRDDGTEFPLHMAVTRVELIEGTVLVAFLIDISKRKRAEEALRKSETFLRGIMENASDAMFVKDRERRMIMANPAYYRLLGKTPDEVLGRTAFEYYPPEIAEAMSVVEERVMMAGSPETVEESMMMPDGLRTVQTTLAPYRDGSGNTVGYIGIARDVTERRLTQQAILEARRRFESIFLGSNEGIALHLNVYDDEGKVVDYRILDVNPAYERITGIPREQAAGKLASELYGTGEPPYLDLFTEVGETGIPKTIETYFGPMDKHFLISIFSPIKGQFATIFIDISERKRLEHEVEEARARAELYVDLLTHDITNYNTAAMGYLQIAEMRLRLEEDDQKLITKPLQVLRNSSELISNIRDLKRVEMGKDRVGPIDVCRLLREVKDAYTDPPGREVDIILDAPVHCWVIASGLLRDAFSNIISNAIEHSSGPVTIHIQLQTEPRGGRQWMKVSFADTGPGISDERKSTIFDRAMMGLNKPVSRGLGLYLVKRLVEDYGGEVWVEDRVPGDHTQGAKFVIELQKPPTS